MMTRTEQMKRRRVNELRFLKLALIALVLLIAATAASYYWFSQSSLPTPKRQKPVTANQPAPEGAGGKVNMLVLGVDHRQDDVGRSDTLFLVTLDIKTKQTSILSIPRDTRVKIPGYGFDKINHTYALGGHQLTQKTVEEFLGSPVDYYIEIDFSGFQKIVDAVGGVDIAVEKRMYYEDPYDNLVIDIKPGIQHMDGDLAIKYVRYRDEEGDIGRIGRQQGFVKAMIDRVSSPGIIVRLPSIITEINNSVRTDLSLAEMIALGKILKEAKDQGLKTDTVPGTPIDIGAVSYLHPDVVALREYMAGVIGFKVTEQYLAEAKRSAVEYEYSLPDETTLTGSQPVAKLDEASGQERNAPDSPQAAKPETAKTVNTKVKDGKPDQIKAVTIKKPAVIKKPPVKPPASQTGPLRVDIINSSGNPAAGEKMAAQLKQQGFVITQINNSDSVNRNTIVIAHSAQDQVLNKVTSLPFNYALQVSPQANSATQVTVVIGKDYTGR